MVSALPRTLPVTSRVFSKVTFPAKTRPCPQMKSVAYRRQLPKAITPSALLLTRGDFQATKPSSSVAG